MYLIVLPDVDSCLVDLDFERRSAMVGVATEMSIGDGAVVSW